MAFTDKDRENLTQRHYGVHLILDMHDCNSVLFTRRSIKCFMIGLCDEINMKRAKLIFWDYKYAPISKRKALVHLKGISAVQFITTSTITIHTLDDLGIVYLDVFSCKDFQEAEVRDYCQKWFKGRVAKSTFTKRV